MPEPTATRLVTRTARGGTGIAVGLLLAWIMVALAGCSGTKATPLPRGSIVVVIGDSITAGHGVGVDNAWTTTLAARTGWQVVNAGVSGDTTAGGRDRLPALLDEHRPAAVIVELGGNDMLRRLPTAQTVANLEAMLATIRSQGAQAILMATPQPSVAGVFLSSLSDAAFYAEIADRLKVPLIKDVLSATLSQAAYKSDHVHPNAAGQRQIGEAASESLRRLGLNR